MTNPHFICSISEDSVAEVEESFAPSRIHGADLRFHGVVRDLEDGRRISGIEYSHYDKMALNEMQKIGESMAREFPEHIALVHHTIGFVAAGEASIVIRVQTAHSAPAYDLCREYLKRIKETVPIWKKPIFEE